MGQIHSGGGPPLHQGIQQAKDVSDSLKRSIFGEFLGSTFTIADKTHFNQSDNQVKHEDAEEYINMSQSEDHDDVNLSQSDDEDALSFGDESTSKKKKESKELEGRNSMK